MTRGRPHGPPYKTFTNQDPTYLHHLRTFGEVGICKNHAYQSSPSNRGVSKHLCNRGKLGVFIGYLPTHPPGTWKFYNPETRSIFKSRDVTWLDTMWGNYKKIKNPPRYETVVLDSDEENPKEISVGSITTVENPRNDFKVGRAPVQDTTLTEIIISNPTDNVPSISTPQRLGPTTRSMTRIGPTTRSMTQTDPTINLSSSIMRSLNSMSTRL